MVATILQPLRGDREQRPCADVFAYLYMPRLTQSVIHALILLLMFAFAFIALRLLKLIR